jgi:NDP-sugar pyrophosphorylase family protein
MFKAQVVILAGGQGLRLRPYTTILPKPLLPLGDIPILEVIIRQLSSFGFRRILIATGYLAELIEAYFGDGRKFGVEIRYVREKEPLGTAGALKLACSTEEHFLVLNGDVLSDMDLRAFLKWHISRKCLASITVKERTIKNDFGVIEIGPDDQLKDYHEKPEYRSYVSMGINAFHKKARELIGPGESIGIPDLMLRLKSIGHKVGCYKVKDRWLDLGRFEDLEKAQEIFTLHKKEFIKSKSYG